MFQSGEMSNQTNGSGAMQLDGTWNQWRVQRCGVPAVTVQSPTPIHCPQEPPPGSRESGPGLLPPIAGGLQAPGPFCDNLAGTDRRWTPVSDSDTDLLLATNTAKSLLWRYLETTWTRLWIDSAATQIGAIFSRRSAMPSPIMRTLKSLQVARAFQKLRLGPSRSPLSLWPLSRRPATDLLMDPPKRQAFHRWPRALLDHRLRPLQMASHLAG